MATTRGQNSLPTQYHQAIMNSGGNNTPGTLSRIYAMGRVSATTLASKITESSLSETGQCVTQLFSENGLQDPEFVYGAQITWGPHLDTVSQWDQVAIWGMDTFGLPGSRYVTEINVNDMTWWFRSEHDRLLFVLRNGQARCTQLESTA